MSTSGNDFQQRLAKYQPASQLDLPNRRWPDRTIEQAPVWCSVDLRDGNQALVNPLGINDKTKFFDYLCRLGFKEIEVGFPAAAETEYNFLRRLIDQQLIPEDVTPQVLCQARSHLITRTFESLSGVGKAIFHVYNSTSRQQREIVFKADRKAVIQIAVAAVKEIRQRAADCGEQIILEYSPESFTGTEADFALEICEAVLEAWQPCGDEKVIINLPATVEVSTPNVYADQIEHFCNNFSARESSVISVHTHNDRGTGIAASELALLAGAQRVEGTLFGNGERTGNADLITMALNLFTQGIDPRLDLSNINSVRKFCETLTQLPVHERHPYAGELVFTAFSGSHQDAIKKGLAVQDTKKPWDVPYLPVDPADIGRNYQAVIRINSQSGKGGVAYILENFAGYRMPKKMHPQVAELVQNLSEQKAAELEKTEIISLFERSLINLRSPLELCDYKITPLDQSGEQYSCLLTILKDGAEQTLSGQGNGPIDAAARALDQIANFKFLLKDYLEHVLDQDNTSSAAVGVAYIALLDEQQNYLRYGAGTHSNTTKAALYALISALNQLMIHRAQLPGTR